MILEVNNLQYDGFSSVSVTSSMDTLYDSFSISANNRWIGGGLKIGDECRILDDDEEAIVEGYIDILHPTTEGRMGIFGRDKSADLAESTVLGTGEFAGLTMRDIIQTIAEPFGIVVSGDEGRKINRFRYDLSQRASDVIRTLVTRQGYLINSDGTGDLVIEKAGSERAGFVLIEGNNILKGSMAEIDGTRLHSLYRVLGQNYDNNVVNSDFTGFSDRYRPITSINSGNIQVADAQTASEWLQRTSDGLAQQYTISVAGLQTIRPNRLVECESPTLGVSGDLIVRSVTWKTDRDGSRTTLKLANPYSFGIESTDNTYL